MKIIYIAPLLLLGISTHAFARREMPIEPAYAAQQSRITRESLEFEVEQFQAIADWNNALDSAVMARGRADLLKRRYERAAELVKIQQVSVEALVTAKFVYEQAVLEAERFDAEAQEYQAAALVAKLQLLQEGGTNRNLLKDLTEARIQVLKYRIEARQAALRCTREEQRINALKSDSGHALYNKKAVSEADLDQREYNTRNAKERAVLIENQIQVAEAALKALELSLARL